MQWMRLGVICAGALLVGVTGCQSKMHDENLALHEQNRKLQAELSDYRARLGETETKLSKAPDPSQVTQMQSRISELEEQLKQAQATATNAPGGKADPSLAGIEAVYDKSRGTLTVTLPGEILFESGKAALKPTAHTTLDKIAAAIKKDYASKSIFVDGHTDADPIVKTKGQWEDNWDLAAGRANAVRQYLTTHGVDGKRVNLRSFGPNSPKATKPASRRVEIVVQVG